MKVFFQYQIFYFLLFYFLLTVPAFPQTDRGIFDPVKKYDEILSGPSDKQEEVTALLPKLDNVLYKNWAKVGDTVIWQPKDALEVLTELGLEKILKQTYQNENHLVDILIYNFKDSISAYSAYTVLHSGASTKLNVGKNASESDKVVNFWKATYFVDLHTANDNDSVAKEFIILFSQDISKNIPDKQNLPPLAIHLPALNRIQGTEKFCPGLVCCTNYIAKELTDFNCGSLNLSKSSGIITAEYQFLEGSKEKERIKLFLIKYTEKETAQATFKSLKESFEKKKAEEKDYECDFDINDSILKVRKQKNAYTMLKQKGDLLALAYGITNKQAGERIFELISWPQDYEKVKQSTENNIEIPETNEQNEKIIRN